ncbi:MAG: FtsX-like permease family protein [Bacteroidota bacterium]
MLKHYFQISLRNLFKNKTHTLINILGLSLGLISAGIIFLEVRYESNFDTYHDKSENIYRVITEDRQYGELDHGVGVPFPLTYALRNDFPEIPLISIVNKESWGPVISATGSDGQLKRFIEEEAVLTDSAFFDIFSYEWISGNPNTALNAPNQAVICRSRAEKYYGTLDVIGKRLNYDGAFDAEIVGVVEDHPKQTELPFSLLLSFDYNEDHDRYDRWNSVSSGVQCYLKLPDNITPEQIEARFPDFIEKYFDEETREYKTYLLQPLRQAHHDLDYGGLGGDLMPDWALLTLGLIGLFLLLTASINFVNLNTILVFTRAKEIGIRKVLGSKRKEIISYLLSETALITFVAFFVALLLINPGITFIGGLFSENIQFDWRADYQFYLFMTSISLLVLVLSGLYPAWLLSRLNPVLALKNKIENKYGQGINLRKMLVILQFAITQFLIICTIMTFFQMRKLSKAELGFDQTTVVEIGIPDQDVTKVQRLNSLLSQHPNIKYATFSNSGAASNSTWGSNYAYSSSNDTTQIQEGDANVKCIDHQYLATYDIKLISGKNFLKGDTSNQYIVNETFVKKVGSDKESIIGKQVTLWGRKGPIIGVIKDFTPRSLRQEIPAMILLPDVGDAAYMGSIKLQGGEISQSIQHIEKSWLAVFPEKVFEYEFLDDVIKEYYEREVMIVKLFQIFAGVAIFIGCIGLFGFISFMAEQRTKEIGVRKVLGASINNILGIFTKEYTWLLLISAIPAIILAYIFMGFYLEQYAYRIGRNPGYFIIGLVATFIVAIATVGYRSFRAATINPVEALKDE